MGSIRNKLLLAFASVTLPLLIGLGWYGGGQVETALRTQGLDRLETRLESLRTQIESVLSGTDGDVLLLANTVSLDQYLLALDSGKEVLINAAERNLSQVFARLLDLRGNYREVRYIDAAGMERVRVERNGNSSMVVPAGRLQNEYKRYYFEQAMKLPEGGVVVSALDLSRENGEIVKPYRPVIRYSTPVFDKAQRRRGILVINVSADTILQLVSASVDKGETRFLVSVDGFYLSHPDASKLWGGPNDLGTEENLLRDMPLFGRKILAAESMLRSEGDDVFRLVLPVSVPGIAGARLGVMVDSISTDVLFAAASEIRSLFNILTLAALVLVLVLGSVVASYVTRPITILTEAVDAMSRGELDQPIVVSSNDEMQTLAVAMERLRKSMKVMLDKYA